MQNIAGLQRLRAGQAMQVAFDLAEVLGAGNNFLPWVAALVEADATDLFEIGHLRHELFLGGQGDEREGRLNIKPAPGGDARRAGLDGKLLPQRSHRRLRRDDHESLGIKANDGCSVASGRRHRFGRAGQSGIGQRLFGLPAGEAEHDGAVGLRGQLYFCPQDEHLQALLRCFLEIGGERQEIALALAPDDKTRLHAPLGRTPSGVLGLAIGQMVDIAGELAVQEGLGFFSRGFDKAEVGQRNNDGLLCCGKQFAGGIAEVEKLGRIIIEDGFGRFQKAAPMGIHEGS